MSALQDELNAGLSGRYKLERELGRGGMAVVFLARDERHDRPVAIKVLAPGVVAGDWAERFQREIRAVSGLSHPHILPVLDSGLLPGPEPRAWFAMPYVPGGSLEERLKREGALPVADAVRIVAETAEALDYAHRQGLIHRDVKPANVLLQDGQAVVADFGVAAALLDEPGNRLTATGLVVGTPGYMSPEQASGETHVDRRTDVYSLGCVLYEALTGHALHADASSPAAVLARLITEDPPLVSRDRPAAADLDPIVSRALARLPADRYGTAGELARALRATTLDEGHGSVGQPRRDSSEGAAADDSRRSWRRPLVVGVAALAVLAALAVGTLAVMGLRSGQSGDAGASGGPSVAFGETRPSLAVLPFESLSPDPDDAFYADGFQEELRTQLSRVEGIRPVAGQSVLRYEGTDLRPSEIAAELGVDYVLGGSLRRVADEVVVAVQLYDGRDDAQLWADSWERPFLDVFEIQADIAVRAVEQLRGLLTPDEEAELAGPDTEVPEALTEYLRGQARFRTLYVEAEPTAAADAYDRAVELDPGFVAAWSRLVQVHLFLSWVWGRPESREVAREGLDRLEALAPGSPEARIARGVWLYYGAQRYDDALRELEIAADLWPGDANVLTYLGAVQRRLGRWEEGARTWEQALRLDPLNASTATNLNQLYTATRQLDDAVRLGRRAIALDASVPIHWWHLIEVRLVQGDTAAVRALVDSAGQALGQDRLESGGWWAMWEAMSGNTDAAVELYRAAYAEDPRSLDGTWGRYWDLGLAVAAAAGRTADVRDLASTLRTSVEGVLPAVAEGDVRRRGELLAKLALAEAYLGNEERAIELGEEAVEVFPVSQDATFGPYVVDVLAQVYSVVGKPDEAVDRLRYLLTIPSRIHLPLLRISPRWHALRGDAGFQALLASQG